MLAWAIFVPTSRRTLPEERLCTLVGCGSSEFAVRLLLDEDLPAGRYRFVFRQDSEITTCEGRLPVAPREGFVEASCDSEFVRFGPFTRSESSKNQVVGRIVFGNLTDILDVQVLRNGRPIMQSHYDVHYPDEYWPNGEECGLRCGHATVDLPLGRRHEDPSPATASAARHKVLQDAAVSNRRSPREPAIRR